MPEALDAIVSELGEADRQERIEMLLDLAKNLPPLPRHLEPLRDAAHRVEECQSPVYLFVDLGDDGRVAFHADAPIEAPTVRGFVAMLVEGLDGAEARAVLDLPEDLIDRSGLGEILGMLRVRGLHGVLRRVKGEVARALVGREGSVASATHHRPEPA